MKPISLAIIIFLLAPAVSALDLAPGTYAISAVGANPCLGKYLAYDTKGAGTGVYLVPSDTSQPPLWRVEPAPGSPGAFLLTAVNPANKARAVLTYDVLSCSNTAVSLGFDGNSIWANSGGFLNAAKRECPPGSAVRLAPVATTGAAACRAVGLATTTATPDPSATTWHFTKYPASPVELYTKGYGKAVSIWAPSVAMDESLLVEGAFYNVVPQPTYWKRGAGGVWRRGNLKLPTTANDILNVAIGGTFVAVSVPVNGIKPKKPFWRVYVYNKAKLGSAPVATLTSPNAVGDIGVYLAAGGTNLAVSNYPNKTFIFTQNKAGKWGAPVTLAVPKSPSILLMSRDGRTLALSVFGEEKIDSDYEAVSSGYVLVFKQKKTGGPWVQEANIQPPAPFGILVGNPKIALDGDNLAVAFESNVTNLFFYRRSSSGAWKLVQSGTPPCEIFRLTGDADTVVASCPYKPSQAFVYKRSKATGKWTGGKARPLPRWKDDFAQGSSNYGEMALAGKRLALTAAFKNQERSSPGVTFIYDNVDDL